MIYWFTGQPGHGKTLHAIQKLLEFKEKGRRVFACNIREFDYDKTGVERMTPEQFRDWMNFLPDGAVALVDEAYEHDMLPKRAPGAKVPAHVEQLAKHRHRGLDFIFVCQSPDTQCDSFVRDLIERHIHVRRRFGTKFVHLREFDRYERNPEKANPLVLRRATLPKKIFGTYKSTELDTTERRIPWYYFAFGLGVPLGLFFMWYTFGNMQDRLGGGDKHVPSPASVNRVGATEPLGEGATTRKARTPDEYISQFLPRVPSQPWSAPIYDNLKVSAQAPRLFCMASDAGEDASGERQNASCSCLTEQGTRYRLAMRFCRMVAENGQYEPFRDEKDDRLLSGTDMQMSNWQAMNRQPLNGAGGVIPSAAPAAVPFPESPSYPCETCGK